MAKFEKEIKEIEGIIIELAFSGCDIDVNMDDLREMLENPDLIISLAQRLKKEKLKVNALNK